MFLFLLVVGFCAVSFAQRGCSRFGVGGTCVTQAVCAAKSASHSWFASSSAGVDSGCASEPSDVRCCVLDRGTLCAKAGVEGRCLTATQCASVPGRGWFASGVDGTDTGCRDAPNDVRCCVRPPPVLAPGQTLAPTPIATPAPTPLVPVNPTGRCNMVTPTCANVYNSCGNAIRFDIEFMPVIAAFDNCARANGVRIGVCSTYRNIAHNARVGGSSSSNHLVGHAIDFELRASNGAVCDESCMLSSSRRRAAPGVQATLDCIQRHPRVAWGGNPSWGINIRGHLDVVHIDDRINVRFASLHSSKVRACNADTTFDAVTCSQFLLSGPALLEAEEAASIDGELAPSEPDNGEEGAASSDDAALIGGIVGGVAALLVVGAIVAVVMVRKNRQLAQQVDDVAMAGTYECNKCDAAFANVEQLSEHVSKQH